MNSPITIQEIEFVAEKLPIKKSPGPDVHWRLFPNVSEELIKEEHKVEIKKEIEENNKKGNDADK